VADIVEVDFTVAIAEVVIVLQEIRPSADTTITVNI
jgi:hypothetical protein